MAPTTLTNDEHARLAEWADEIAERRRPQGAPTCEFCYLFRDGKEVKMLFRHGNIHREPIAWGQNRKCPECYHIEAFGIPLYEDEYDKTFELMGDSRNYNGKPQEDLEEQEVKEQLGALGYLDI